MVIVCALADPEPRTRFIYRCLVAAYDAGLDPLLVLTKSDLAPPRKIGLPAARDPDADHEAAPARADADPAAQGAHGRISVLIGQSGVGKSSLVNELVPDADGRSAGSTP